MKTKNPLTPQPPLPQGERGSRTEARSESVWSPEGAAVDSPGHRPGGNCQRPGGDQSRSQPVSGQVSASVRRRRIGIHGPRNAGKTCFLGCLYGFRNHPDTRITFGEDATVGYLASLWEPLSKQET